MCEQSSFCYNVMSKIVDVNISMRTMGTYPLNNGKRSPIKFRCSVGQFYFRLFCAWKCHSLLFSPAPDTRNGIKCFAVSVFHQNLHWRLRQIELATHVIGSGSLVEALRVTHIWKMKQKSWIYKQLLAVYCLNLDINLKNISCWQIRIAD